MTSKKSDAPFRLDPEKLKILPPGAPATIAPASLWVPSGAAFSGTGCFGPMTPAVPRDDAPRKRKR